MICFLECSRACIRGMNLRGLVSASPWSRKSCSGTMEQHGQNRNWVRERTSVLVCQYDGAHSTDMMDYKHIEILLVEDSKSDAELTIRALTKSGFASKLKHVTDGAEALDYLYRKGEY